MQKREVVLRIFEGEVLLYQAFGFNQAIISDLMLIPDPTGEKDLFIEAKFDLNEWPEAIVSSEET